jgi:hypothetical protein
MKTHRNLYRKCIKIFVSVFLVAAASGAVTTTLSSAQAARVNAGVGWQSQPNFGADAPANNAVVFANSGRLGL